LVNSIKECVSELDKDPLAQDDLYLPELCTRLAEVEVALGGKKKAYAIERKTRMFIDEILKHLSTKFNDGAKKILKKTKVYIEMENEIRLYGETIRPDY
jgi:hypothetical protein